jgi:hypothetical protein
MYFSKLAFVAVVFASASAFSQSPKTQHVDSVIPLPAVSAELTGGSASDSCGSSPVKCGPALRSDFVGLSALVTLAASVAPSEADAGTHILPENSTIYVVNNGHDRVSVYIVGRNGQRHFAGTVTPTGLGQFGLPAGLANLSESVSVQIFPRFQPAGLGSASRGGTGIRTTPMMLGSRQSIVIFVEPTLDRSTAQATAVATSG